MSRALRAALTGASALLAGAVITVAATAAPQDNFVRIAPNASNAQEVRLGVNKSVVVDLPADAGDILVSDPEVADAVLRTSRRLYIMGNKFGQANIFVFDRAGRQLASIDLVVDIDLSGLENMLRRVLPQAEIEAEAVNGSVVLSGTVRSSLEAARAEEIARQMLSRLVRTFTTSGGAAVTEISDERSGAIINLLKISGAEQVALKVTIAEVRRDIVKRLGIDTAAAVQRGLNGKIIGTDVLAEFAGVADGVFDSAGAIGIRDTDFSFDAIIRALDETRVLRTLAEPTLTAVSGQEAGFFAGGEFPYEIVTVADGQRFVTQAFKQVGVKLDFTPTVLSGGRIHLLVSTEVSELRDAVTGAITQRQVQTGVELPSGGAFVVGGLIQETARKTMTETPGISRLPILGQLFSSRAYENAETELVVLVTPYIVEPVDPDALAKPTDNLIMADDAQTVFLGRVNKIYGRGAAGPRLQGRYGFAFD